MEGREKWEAGRGRWKREEGEGGGRGRREREVGEGRGEVGGNCDT